MAVVCILRVHFQYTGSNERVDNRTCSVQHGTLRYCVNTFYRDCKTRASNKTGFRLLNYLLINRLIRLSGFSNINQLIIIQSRLKFYYQIFIILLYSYKNELTLNYLK